MNWRKSVRIFNEDMFWYRKADSKVEKNVVVGTQAKSYTTRSNYEAENERQGKNSKVWLSSEIPMLHQSNHSGECSATITKEKDG